MKYENILVELRYIDENYEFSPEITPEVEKFLLENNLISIDSEAGLVFTTIEGELLTGSSKEDLREQYDDQAYETYDDVFEKQEGSYDK